MWGGHTHNQRHLAGRGPQGVRHPGSAHGSGRPQGYAWRGPHGHGGQPMHSRGFSGHGSSWSQMHSAHRGPAPWMHAPMGPSRHAGFARYRADGDRHSQHADGHKGRDKDDHRDSDCDGEHKDRDDHGRGHRDHSKRESSRHRDWK